MARIGIGIGASRGRPLGGEPPVSLFGFNPNHDAGIDGTYFVDPAAADDNGTGAEGDPFKTINFAVGQFSPGDTIRLRGGDYPESIDYNVKTGTVGNIIKLARYGTERPRVVGCKTLTGLVACEVGDNVVVGDAWSNCFKVTLPKSSFEGTNLMCLNLHEAGSMMPVAFDRANRNYPKFLSNDQQFHTAESFTVNGDPQPKITHIVDPIVFDQYTAAQLLEAYVYLLHGSNRVGLQSITGYDAGTHTAAVDGLLENASLGELYGLANIGPKIEQGQWCVVDADPNVVIYVWPIDDNNIDTGITYSARSQAINLRDCSYGIIEGIEFCQFGGDGGIDAIIRSTNPIAKTDITIKQFSMSGYRFCHPGLAGYGAFNLNHINNLTIENYDLTEFVGANGVGLITSDGTTRATNLLVQWGDLTDIEYSAMRLFEQESGIWAFHKMRRCSHATHANKAVVNECDKVTIWAPDYVDSRGYIKWSETSNFIMGMAHVTPIEHRDDARCIVDQNTGSNEPVPNSDNFIINVMCPPGPNEASTSFNSVHLGTDDETQNFGIFNSAIHGGGVYDDVSWPPDNISLGHGGNTYTHLTDSWGQLESELNPNESYDPVILNTYADYVNRDYTLVPGNKIETTPPEDISAIIDILEARHPDFDIYRDINGVPFAAFDFNCPDSTIVMKPAVPPVLTLPVDAANGATVSTGSASSTVGTGPRYWVVTTSDVSPDADQIIAGTDNADAPAAADGVQTITATGVTAINPAPSGLTPETEYFTHFVHVDLWGQPSNVVSADGFTTDAASAWVPTDETGNTGWWDPSDLSTLWQDTGKTVAVEVNDPVRVMEDKSGGGRDFVASGDAVRPILRQSGSLFYLEFDGSDDALSSSAISNFIANDAYELGIGLNFNTIGTNASNPWQNDAVFAETGGIVAVYARSSGLIGAYNWDGNADVVTSAYTAGNDAVWTQRHDGGNLYGRLNADTEVSTASGNTTSLTGTLKICKNQAAGTFADLKFYGAAIYNVVLSGAARTSLREYMADQAGVTL